MNSDDTEITSLTDFNTLKLTKRPYLIVVSGPRIGHRYPVVLQEMIIGRGSENHIALDDANASRRHARVLSSPDLHIEDLESTNGTFVNSQRIRHHVLAEGDMISIGKTVLKFSYQNEIDNSFQDEILRSAKIDELTGLTNRRFFQQQLHAELQRTARYNRPVALMICDLDNFKHINDSYGHPAGDTVLHAVGQTIAGCLRREIDLAGRYGGEEFVVLLPETTRDQALNVAEKIRDRIEQLTLYEGDTQLPVTTSVGVSARIGTQANADLLLREADDNLYRAKREGKNRVVG